MLANPYPDELLEYLPDTVNVNNAVDTIRNYKQGEKPMFIYIPTLRPHPPYHSTEFYHNMYNPNDAFVLPPEIKNKPAYYSLVRKYRKMENIDESILRKIHAVYLGMCSYCDMLLGRILDALDETGLVDDTTLIVSSDHGDWAGDYGLVEKWPNALDDDMTKIPLIIRSPGCKAGHRVSELTEMIDIFPTICDIENIEVRHDHFGKSLKNQVGGSLGDPNRVVYCEGGYDIREPHAFEGTANFAMFMDKNSVYYSKMLQQIHNPESVARSLMARNSRYKINIRTNDENELYDMLQDPNELNNLYYELQYKEMVNIMQQEALVWLVHTSDVVPWEKHK